MEVLINQSDKNLMDNVELVKNATFYKDLLAFYDAYIEITSRAKQDLPNFCFVNDRLLLDGLCLLIKDLASEFKFSTLNLSIDYLKILYFSMASFAKDSQFPERETIVEDMNQHKKACQAVIEKNNELVEKKSEEYLQFNTEYDLINNKIKNIEKNKNTKKSLLFLSALVLISSVIFATINLTLLKISTVLVTIICLVVVVALVLVCIVLLKSLKNLKGTEQSIRAQFEKLEKKQNQINASINDDTNSLNRLISELYEYNNNLSEKIYKLSSHGLTSKILLVAENKMLSYNMQYDVNLLSKKQDEEISQIVSELENKNANLIKIYSKISEKYFIYNNNYVRYKFISRFWKSAIKSHNYMVEINGEKKYPFDINLKSLLGETVLVKSKGNKKLTALPFEYLNSSNLFEKEKLKRIENAKSVTELKQIKKEYSLFFYDKNKEEEIQKCFDEGADSLNLINYSQIPMILEIEEKLRGADMNLENSKSNNIIKTIEGINKNLTTQVEDSSIEVFPDIIIDEYNYSPIEEEFDEIKDINDYAVKCKLGDKEIIGFKIDD